MGSFATPHTGVFSTFRRGARVLAAVFLLLMAHGTSVTAADISLFQSDPVGQSSFNTGTSWTGGLAPTNGNNYLTGTFTLRTPNDSASNFTFAGDALTIDASGALRYMGLANSAPVITVNNLIMDGGLIINGANEMTSGTSTLTLSGTMMVKSNSGLDLGIGDSMQHNVVLNSTLTGTGGFYIGTSTVSGSINPAALVTINGNNSGFSGGVFISRNYVNKLGGTVTLNGTNVTYPQIMSSATIRLGHANALGTGQLAIDAGTVDLNGLSPSIGSLAGTGGAVVNDGGGAATLTVGGDNTTSAYSGTIRDRNSGAGTLALTKTGNGVLTLSGSNSYTGGTQINAGVLAFGHTSGLGTGTVTIGSGTLRAAVPGTVANPIAVNAARIDTNGNAVTLSGVISGSNGLTKVATTGTLTLAGDNTFTGNVVVDGTGSMSVLVATRSTSLGTGTKTVTVAGYERSLVLDGSGGNITLGSNISYSFSNETSPVLRNLSGTNTIFGSIGMTVGGAGTLIQSDAGALTLAGNIGVTSANSRNLFLSGSAGGTVSGTVGNGNGTTVIIKQGNGTWTLSGSNNYTGGTQINAGVLATTNASALGTGTVTISSGTLRTALSGTVANPIAVNAARIDTNGNAVTLSGVISGSNGFTKTATTGTLTLAGDNSFTGDVSLDGITSTTASVLVVTRNTSLGTGAKTVTVTGFGKTLVLDGSAGDITLASPIGLTLSNDGSAVLLNRAGNNTISGSIGMTAGGGGTNIQSDAGSLTLTGSIGVITGTRLLHLRGSAGGTVSGNITNGSGTAVLRKSEAGTWTLTGSNTYSGTTSVSAGVLTFGRQAALYGGTTASWTRSNITVESGATLGVQVGDAASGYFDATAVATLLGAGGLGASDATSGLRSGALFAFDTTNATGGSFTYASAIANPNSGTNVLGIVKFGSGTLTLSGSNTYSGTTTLSAGVLNLASAETAGTSGPLGRSTATGSIVLSGGTLQYSSANGGYDYSSRFSTAANQRYNVDTNGQNVTWATNLTSSTGSLAKLGSGTLTLNGNNTYSGGATVSLGRLTLGHANALGTGTATVGGGELDIATFAPSIAGFRITSGTLLGTGTLTSSSTYDVQSGSVVAPLGGSVGLTKSAVGTVTLTGNNTYTGLTTVSAGTLSIGSGGTAGSVAGNIANNAALVFNRSDNLAYSGVISGSGSLRKLGAGTLTLSGSAITTGSLLVGFNDTASGTNTLTAAAASAVSIGTGASDQLGVGIWDVDMPSAVTSVLDLRNASTLSINVGTLRVGVANAVGATASAKNALLQLPGASTITAATSFVIGDSGAPVGLFSESVTTTGAGTTTLRTPTMTVGGNKASGSFTLGAGTLDLAGVSGGRTAVAVGDSASSTFNNFTGTADFSQGTFTGLLSSLVVGRMNNGNPGTETAVFTLGSSASNRLDISGAAATNGAVMVIGRNLNVGSGVASGTVTIGNLDSASQIVATDNGTAILLGSRTSTGPAAGTLNLNGGTLTITTTGTGITGGSGTSTVNFNGTTLRAGAASANWITGLTTANIQTGGALFDTNAFNVTVAQAFSGTGGLTKLGAGTLTLSGSNTNLGGATVNAGRLTLGHASALGTGTLTIGGGELDIATFAPGVAGFRITSGTLLGTGTLTSSSTYDVQAGSVVTNLGGSVGLTKSTAGTVTLSGANTYSGQTTVSSGVLALGAANAISNQSNLLVNGGGFDLSTFNDTVGTVTLTSGSILGSGTLSGSSYALQGGQVNARLGTGSIAVSTGTTTLGSAGRLNSASGLTISSGQLTLGGSESVASFVLSGGVLAGSGNMLTSAANHDIRAGSVLANLGGSVGLTKSTIGTAVLGAANSYVGATSITAGLLEIAAAGSINSTSGITVNGSTAWLAYNSATALSQPLTLTQGTLSGTGTIATAVAIGSGVFHSPGNSPGIQTVASETWNPGGTYVWELNALEGNVGTNWDQIAVTGLLDLDALSTGDRFNLNLVTLTAGNTAGPLAVGYVPGSEYRYTIATFGSLSVPTGFTTTANSNLTGLFTVNLGGWQGTQPDQARISVQVNSAGTAIDLVIVPEPGSLALAAAGLGAVGYVRWRRRRLARAGSTS